MTSAVAGGTSGLQSSPSTILRRISVPEYVPRSYIGGARTSYPASANSLRVIGLFVYTVRNGGHMASTWATHTEYLFRSSMGTMLQFPTPASLRALSIMR